MTFFNLEVLLEVRSAFSAHLVFTQSLLGVDVSQHHTNIGDHGVVEAVPRKADLLHG